MKTVMIILGMVIVLISSVIVGCGKNEGEKEKDLVGTYVNKDDSSEYFELEEDGTYHYHHEKLGYDLTGEWEVKGNKLIVSYPTTGPMPPSKIKGDKIIGEDGSVHIKVKKRSSPPPKPTSIPGEYIDEQGEVLIINNDGTFKFKEPIVRGMSRWSGGVWKINGNKIAFHVYLAPGIHQTIQSSDLSGEIKGDIIYSADGTIWIKQESRKKITKKEAILGKEISKDSISGEYTIEVIEKDGTIEKNPGIIIFREDGKIVLRSPDLEEFVIPDQKWEFKNGTVQIYQYGIDGPSEPLIGKVKGDTIIFKLEDGELRYVREDGRSFFLDSFVNLSKSESKNKGGTNLFPFADIIERNRTWNPVFTSWYGKPAPDFSVYDVDGKLYKLSDCRGKNILLIFWATWASLCRAEIPHLIELRNQINDENLVMLAMSNEDMNTLRRFVEKKKLNYSIVSISSSSLPVPFNQINFVPTMFFIDATGKIRLAAAGIVSLNEMKAILTKSRSEPIQEVKSKTFSDVFKQIDTRLKLYSDKSSFPRPPISLTLRMTVPHLVEKVETIYFSALDYQFLSLKSLRYAKYFLDGDDISKANKYIEKADRYYKLATSLQRDSLAVLQSTISAAEWMVVYKASRTALGFTATGLGIEASIIFDIGTLYTDYLLDTSTISVEEAKKNLIAKAISNVLLQFTGASEFVGDAVKHGWGSSRAFPVLQKIMGSSEFKDAVLKEFMRLGGDIGDYAAKRTIEEALGRIVRGAITPSYSKEDSQEPPVQTDKRKNEQTKEIKEQIEEKVEETVESLLDQLFKKKR